MKNHCDEWTLSAIADHAGQRDQADHGMAIEVFYDEAGDVVAAMVWPMPAVVPAICIKEIDGTPFPRRFTPVFADDIPPHASRRIFENCFVEYWERNAPVALACYAPGEPEPILVLARQSLDEAINHANKLRLKT